MAKHILPSLPVKFSLSEANETIGEELVNNNWEIETPVPVLELVPYYIFQYDSFSEAEEAVTKTRKVDASSQGISSLNAVTNKLDDVISEMSPPELIQSEFSDPKDVKINVREPRLSLDEAKAVAQIKIAAQEHVARANVHIAGIRLVYVPYWVYQMDLDEDTHVKIRMNAVDGEYEDEESGIPFQGKTKSQLLRETVSDLQHPSGWVEYFSNFIKDFFLLFRPSQEHPNRWVMVLLLIVIALALLALGFVKLP